MSFIYKSVGGILNSVHFDVRIDKVSWILSWINIVCAFQVAFGMLFVLVHMVFVSSWRQTDMFAENVMTMSGRTLVSGHSSGGGYDFAK